MAITRIYLNLSLQLGVHSQVHVFIGIAEFIVLSPIHLHHL